MSLPIHISPALTPLDFHHISALENEVFYNDLFSIVAFGPDRGSSANIEERARGLERAGGGKGEGEGEREWGVIEKAILRDEEGKDNGDGEGEIVGAAVWSFVIGREKEGEGSMEKGNVKSDENQRDVDIVKGRGEGLKARKGDDAGDVEEGEKKNPWGISANVKFCEDVFLVADEHMIKSTEGRDYAKLNVLIVSSSRQRRGIGTQLLQSGLQEVDRLGLQCVLAASKEGVGLYERFGFVETERMELRFGEYEGGEGLGEDVHIVMWRPAKGTGKVEG